MHDPHAGENVRRGRPDLRVIDSVEPACDGASLMLVVTEGPQYAAIDPVDLREVFARRTVLDTRQVLGPERWIAAGGTSTHWAGGLMRIMLWHGHGSWTTHSSRTGRGGYDYLLPVAPVRGSDGLGRARTWG